MPTRCIRLARLLRFASMPGNPTSALHLASPPLPPLRVAVVASERALPTGSEGLLGARDDPSRWWHFRRRASGRFATPKYQGRRQAALPGASIRVAHSARPHPAVRTGQGPWRETRDAGCRIVRQNRTTVITSAAASLVPIG